MAVTPRNAFLIVVLRLLSGRVTSAQSRLIDASRYNLRQMLPVNDGGA